MIPIATCLYLFLKQAPFNLNKILIIYDLTRVKGFIRVNTNRSYMLISNVDNGYRNIVFDDNLNESIYKYNYLNTTSNNIISEYFAISN